MGRRWPSLCLAPVPLFRSARVCRPMVFAAVCFWNVHSWVGGWVGVCVRVCVCARLTSGTCC
jgi:hypothetical protein